MGVSGAAREVVVSGLSGFGGARCEDSKRGVEGVEGVASVVVDCGSRVFFATGTRGWVQWRPWFTQSLQ